MNIKLRSIDGTLETEFLRAMVLDKQFLTTAHTVLDPATFPAMFAQRVARWSIDHFKKYKEPPGAAVEAAFKSWVHREKPDEDEKVPVRDFIHSLSRAFRNPPPINAPYLLDELNRYIVVKRMETLNAVVADALSYGRTEEALDSIAAFKLPNDEHKDESFGVLNRAAYERAYVESGRSLIEFPKDAQWFFRDAFQRDSLIAIQGPEKRGKTAWCLEFMFRAIRSKRNVAMFQTGDLSESQLIRRVSSRVARLPLHLHQCEGVIVPKSIKIVNGDDGPEPRIEAEQIKFPHPVDFRSAWKAQKLFNKANTIDSERPTVRFSVHSNSSINVAGIHARLTRWRENYGFTPDCIAKGSLVLTDRGLIPIENVDYADKLWDGVSWVNHGGVVSKGIRRVTSYQGLTATADHKVWTEQGWRNFESCQRLQLRIATTELEGREIRLGDCRVFNREGATERKRLQVLPLCSMQKVSKKKMVFSGEFENGKMPRLSSLYAAKTVPYMGGGESGGNSTTVHQQRCAHLGVLWRAWDQIQFSIRGGLRHVLTKCAGSKRKYKTHGSGQDRQRRPLRTGKFETIDVCPEQQPYEKKSGDCQSPLVQVKTSRGTFQFFDSVLSAEQKKYERMRCREVVGKSIPQSEGAAFSEVFDIVDAGPFHRFTVSGVLVHNCILVDYADILAPEDRRRDTIDQIDETWRALRRLSQDWHACVVVPTQANAASYTAKTIRMSNFSGSKKKNAHVTGIIGLNQTTAEKSQGVMRLNWVNLRGDEYDENTFLWVAQCLPLNIAMVTCADGRHAKPR